MLRALRSTNRSSDLTGHERDDTETTMQQKGRYKSGNEVKNYNIREDVYQLAKETMESQFYSPSISRIINHMDNS